MRSTHRENRVRGKDGYRRGVGLRALAGQPAENAALGHLKAGCDGGYSGQRGWQACHVRLHVAQQLLQLVQNWGPGHGERRPREKDGEREEERARKEIRSQMDRGKVKERDVKEPEIQEVTEVYRTEKQLRGKGKVSGRDRDQTTRGQMERKEEEQEVRREGTQGRTLEDMGQGVVRTSHIGRGRFGGWGGWGGNGRRHGRR